MKRFLKLLITVVIVVAVAVGGYFLYQRNQTQKSTAASANIQTVQVTKGTLTATVGATGNVRTTQSATVAWKVKGKVGSVNVQVGDTVKAGQVLASLDPSSLPQSLIQAKANLITAQTTLDNLVTVDPVALAQAEKAVTDAQTALQNAIDVRNYYANKINNPVEINIAQQNIIDIQNGIQELQQKLLTITDIPVSSGRRGPVVPQVSKEVRQAQVLAEISKEQSTLRQAQSNLAWLQGNDRSKADMQKYDTQVTLAQAQLQTAQTNLSQVQAGPKASDLAVAQANIDAIKAQLTQADIVAPFDGTITDVGVMTGDLVSNGTAAFRIDVMSPFYVDLQVSELDINKIQVGQPVEFTFDGIPNKTYTGTVEEIGSVGATSSGVVNFTVTVSMQKPDSSVKPGMSVAANIVITQLPDVLLVPTRAIRTVNNQQEVFTVELDGYDASGHRQDRRIERYVHPDHLRRQ